MLGKSFEEIKDTVLVSKYKFVEALNGFLKESLNINVTFSYRVFHKITHLSPTGYIYNEYLEADIDGHKIFRSVTGTSKEYILKEVSECVSSNCFLGAYFEEDYLRNMYNADPANWFETTFKKN